MTWVLRRPRWASARNKPGDVRLDPTDPTGGNAYGYFTGLSWRADRHFAIRFGRREWAKIMVKGFHKLRIGLPDSKYPITIVRTRRYRPKRDE